MNTIKDVAEQAGVSVNTVSRALNNKPDVSHVTRQRVLEVAKGLDYVPNALARSLVRKNTKTIGVTIGDNSNPYFATILKVIEKTARGRGYTIFVCNTDENPLQEAEAIDVLREKMVDGLLVTPVVGKGNIAIQRLRDAGVPFVVLARALQDIKADCVTCDNVKGGFQAVRHLIDNGHTRIAHIAGPQGLQPAMDRYKGYMNALSSCGITPDPSLVKWGNVNMSDGKKSMHELLSAGNRPTAVFAFSDFVAMGVMMAVREVNLRIPEEVALVGYDNIEFSSFLDVPLTTVSQPRTLIGETAINLLIDKIEKKVSDEPQQIVFQPELVIRKSSGAIASG